MSPEEFRAQLEYDFAWRKREMNLLTNQIGRIPAEDREIYCKALLVMLYSHLEGFCKVAFLAYLKLINEERIARSSATEYVNASSLLDVFHDIEFPAEGNNCCDIFNISSGETKFLKFFVRTHFIRKLDEILGQEINISERLSKKIVDTKSNLSPDVISTILYRLGLPYDNFDNYKSDLCNLLMRRNHYAHGEQADGIKDDKFLVLEEKVYLIITELIALLTEAAENRAYLKS